MKAYCLAALLFLLLSSCEGPQGPQGPTGGSGSSGTELLVDPTILPKLIDMYPPPNSQGPYPDGYPIHIRFNKIMDRASLRRAFAVSSPNTSIQFDSASMQTVGGDIFSLYLKGYSGNGRWKVGEIYSVTIGASARDVNGNVLTPSFAATFRPEPFFRIRSTNPEDGQTDIDGETYITCYTNSPVDTTIFSSVQVFPPVTGGWVWGSYDSTYIYLRTSQLTDNTTYTVTVNPTAHDVYGNRLQHAHTFSFRTSEFKVRSAYPTIGTSGFELTYSISIRFTNVVDTSTVRRAVRILPTTSFSYSTYSSNIEIYPIYGWHPDTTYSVRIDTSLRSSGGRRLQSPYELVFRTQSFKVSYTSPNNGATLVNRNPYIYVSFNANIDTSTVRSNFSMNGVAGMFTLNSGSSFYFQPSATLLAYTRYTVNLQTGIRTATGARLKSPYSFSFTTGG
ncbi:MAG: Ig-like domain-containing protein [Ignavibacteriae bacterium]|nr:Ig-like domain-containing protein [Ignavibacteriota bacterium]